MFVTHSSLNGIEPATEPQESSADPMAKLVGDWSWHPERQPKDPGYVYSEDDLEWYELCRAFVTTSYRIPALRSWSIPAYHGPEARPARIGPRT